MKLSILTCLLATAAMVTCNSTFLGTNVLRPLAFHKVIEFPSKLFQKRVENWFYQLPAAPGNAGKTIQGIMAYDLKESEASANVTLGGIGHNFVNLRMKSERGRSIKYDVYIYL